MKKIDPKTLAYLRSFNPPIETVSVTFSGSGDEGFIEESIAEPGGRSLYDDPTLDSWLNGVLDEAGVDWYNNEGGYGTFELNVVAGTYALEIYVNEVTSSLAFSA